MERSRNMDENFPQRRRSFLAEMEPYLERNEPRTVLDLAKERLQKSPDDLDSRIAICRARLLQGNINEAGEMLQQIEDALAGLARLYLCMGDACLKRGREDEAEMFYRKAAALSLTAPLSLDWEARLKGLGNPDGEGDVEQEEAEGENASVPPDFETVTLAELYLRQGHLQMAEKILEKIAGRNPLNDRAKELLNDLRGTSRQKESSRINGAIITELTRWLDNIGALRSHAA